MKTPNGRTIVSYLLIYGSPSAVSSVSHSYRYAKMHREKRLRCLRWGEQSEASGRQKLYDSIPPLPSCFSMAAPFCGERR